VSVVGLAVGSRLSCLSVLELVRFGGVRVVGFVLLLSCGSRVYIVGFGCNRVLRGWFVFLKQIFSNVAK